MRDNDNERSASPVADHDRRQSRSSSKSSKRSYKSRRSSYSRSRSRSRGSEDGCRLHIADIGNDVRKSDLEKVFSQFGELKEVWMTNSSPIFGFAVYKDKKSGNEALKSTDGMQVHGSRIRVSYARPRTRGCGNRFFNNNMRCYQCGYAGHFCRDCPDLNGGEKRYRNSRRYSGGGGGGGGSRDRNRDYDRDYGRHRRSSGRRYDDDYGRRSSRRSSVHRHRY